MGERPIPNVLRQLSSFTKKDSLGIPHPRTTTMTKLKKSSKSPKPFTNLQRKHFFVPLYSWSVLSILSLPYLLEMKNKVLIFLKKKNPLFFKKKKKKKKKS